MNMKDPTDVRSQDTCMQANKTLHALMLVAACNGKHSS
jgi:hypothetical protein